MFVSAFLALRAVAHVRHLAATLGTRQALPAANVGEDVGIWVATPWLKRQAKSGTKAEIRNLRR